MKKFAYLLLAIFYSMASFSQNGAISDKMMEKIRQGYSATSARKAARNALSKNSIAVLAVNAENAAMMDTHFTYEVPTKGRTDQQSSGRCWLFTGLNVLRAEMISKYNLGEFQFSQNFCSFYDLLEKSNLFLQAIIDTRDKDYDDRTVDWLLQNPIGDGGTFCGVANIVMKYGIVPASVFPETYQSENTSQMRNILSQKLRQYSLELREIKSGKLAERKLEMLSEIYGILVACLGEPPADFEWTMYDSGGKMVSRKRYTPKSFYNEYVGRDLENSYILVMNDPVRDYGKVYEIEYDRHTYEGNNWKYVNLPTDRIKEMAVASIKDSTALYFSCDVNKFIDRTKGSLDLANMDYESLFDTEFPMDKRQRVLTHASGSSHAMTLIAVDLDDSGSPRKWMVENSWGTSSGYKGNLIMTDEWFDEYMFRLVVDRKYVPEDILRMMDQTPISLPAWDPMFLPEE